MQARIKKLGEGRYALVKEAGGEQATVPMKRQQVRALILEVLYGPKADQLLGQADEEFAQQQELDQAIAGDSSEMAPPSLPTAPGDSFELKDEDFGEREGSGLADTVIDDESPKAQVEKPDKQKPP